MIKKTPARQKRDTHRRRRQEKKWASQSGPVVVRIDPSIIKR